MFCAFNRALVVGNLFPDRMTSDSRHASGLTFNWSGEGGQLSAIDSKRMNQVVWSHKMDASGNCSISKAANGCWVVRVEKMKQTQPRCGEIQNVMVRCWHYVRA